MTFLLLLGGGVDFEPTIPPGDGILDPGIELTLILELSDSKNLAEVQNWLPIEDFLRSKAGGLEGAITITHGRDTETDQFRAGTFSSWVDNTGRDFDTTNEASDFAGALKARRQLRFRMHAGRPGSPTSPIKTKFRGFSHGFPRRYGEANTFSWVQLEASDGSRIFQQSNLTEGVFTLDDDVLGILDVGRLAGDGDIDGQELSGVRVESLADVARWPVSLRAIDPGLILVGEQTARSGLEALQQVSEAEDGATYFREDGTLEHLDRLYPWTRERSAVSQITIGPGQPVGYVDIDGIGPGDARLRNDVRRSGLSGNERSATDLGSVDEYGWATDGPSSVIAVNDDDVDGIVQSRILRYAVPLERIESITIDVIDEAHLLEVLERQVLDRITVLVAPPGGGPYDPMPVIVQGIDLNLTPGQLQASYRLGPVPTVDLFTLDDDLLGLLDDEALLAP